MIECSDRRVWKKSARREMQLYPLDVFSAKLYGRKSLT